MSERRDSESSTVESGDSGDSSPATDDRAADGERADGSERAGDVPSREPGESGPAEPSASASTEQGGQRTETGGESGLTTFGTAAEPGESGPAEPGTGAPDEPRGEAAAGPSAEASLSVPDAADTAGTGTDASSRQEGTDDNVLAEPGESGPAGENEPARTPEPDPAAGELGEFAEPGEHGEPEEPDGPEERRAREPTEETEQPPEEAGEAAKEAADESPEQVADEPEAGEPDAEAAQRDQSAREAEGGDAAGDARAPAYGDHDADNSGPMTFASNSEATGYGRAMWGDAAGNLSAGEREALRGYSGEKSPGEAGPPDYREINGFLRGKSAGSPEVANSVQRIDHALQSGATPENVMVLRETGLGAFDRPVGELRGSIQRDPAYLSTALGSDPSFNATAPAVLHLEVPAGTPAMYMEGLSRFPSERELLLGRGLRYQVGGVQRMGGRWHIYGKILAP